MLSLLTQIVNKIYPYFIKDPMKSILFIAIIAFLWNNNTQMDYIKQLRAEDSQYYEHQIQTLEAKLETCHNEHIDDVRNFNHTLTRVDKHLDSIQVKR